MTWPQVAIGELGRVVTGSTPSTSMDQYFGGEIPFVTPAELDQPDPVISTPRTLTASGATQARLLPGGAVMVCCIGSVGKTGIAGRSLVTNQQINSIIFDERRVLPRYGLHAVRPLKNTLEAMAPATTVAIVNKSRFEALTIPVPPLEEQRRIAAILDQADDLRRKRREALTLLQNVARTIFLEMFGDPVGNNLGWPLVRLGEAGTLDRGVSKHRPRNDPALLGGPYPLIQTGEVTNSDGYIRNFLSTYSEIGLRQSKLWPKGTLCITIAANIGRAGILTFDACFPDSVVGFVPGNGVRTEFVQQWLAFILTQVALH